MASEAPNKPSSSLTENGRKGANTARTGEEQNVDQVGSIGEDKGIGTGVGGRIPSKCLPKSNEIPALRIKSEGLEAHIQYMKDHALIAKFVGIWTI